jgi:hypothetical protein
MPATYEPIATTKVTGSSTTQIDFNSIPSTYTDLVISINLVNGTSLNALYMRFNSDTGSNYAYLNWGVNGTTLFGQVGSGANTIGVSASSINDPMPSFINIFSYANTDIYKTGYTRSVSQGNPRVGMYGFGWSSKSAISSISFYRDSGSPGVIGADSVITIYGIKAA